MRTLLFILFLPLVPAWAQNNDAAYIAIEVSYDKSVLIQFGTNDDAGAAVEAWNCGSSESVGVTKRQNKIVLQANEEYFAETNLLVELKNGQVFAFILKYNNGTQKLIHKVTLQSPEQSVTAPAEIATVKQESREKTSDDKKRKDASKEKEPVKQQAVTQRESVKTQEKVNSISALDEAMFWAEQFSRQKDYLSRLAVVESKFIFYVGGIWVQGDKMYFKINLVNESPIAYDINSRNFFIKAKKSAAAIEKVNLIGIYNDDQKRVDARSIGTFVAVFDKFTIGDNKVFIIQYWEKGGERNFELQIKPVELLNAKLGL